MTSSQPNFLILFSDQLRADALGAYGNPIADTPAIDRLAAEGVTYDAAYTPSPVCVPARSSFITGLEPHNGGCYENEMPMSQASTFMDALTSNGYRTHGIGKMHFTPDGSALRGFETRDTGEEFGTVETDDYLAHVAREGYDSVEHPHGLRDEMYYVPQLSPVPEPLHHSHWVADRSISFLEEQSSAKPFLLWSSFIAPHPPFAPPSPWHRRYEPSVMPDPFEPQGGEHLLTSWNRLQNRYKYRDGGRSRRLDQLLKAYYFGSVAYLDSQIARIIDALDRSGLRENTVILLTADHGEFLGDYGSYGKRSFLDKAARIPFIWNANGLDRGRVEQPVSLIDVYPTLLDFAGIAAPARDGESIRSLTPGRTIYGQYQEKQLGLYAVITSSWKYIWSAVDQQEYLIDRIHDSAETMNLAYNPRRREVLLQMRELAKGHFDDLGDCDFDALSSNGEFHLGERANSNSMRTFAALDRDRDASTLVVRDDPWPAPAGS
jgi:arylsulfatase